MLKWDLEASIKEVNTKSLPVLLSQNTNAFRIQALMKLLIMLECVLVLIFEIYHLKNVCDVIMLFLIINLFFLNICFLHALAPFAKILKRVVHQRFEWCLLNFHLWILAGSSKICCFGIEIGMIA